MLARNVHFGHLEVDFIARKAALVVLVEVRTRGAGAWETAFGSVTRAKRRRLRAALERYWATARSDPTIERVRIDCAAVTMTERTVTVEIAEAIA